VSTTDHTVSSMVTPVPQSTSFSSQKVPQIKAASLSSAQRKELITNYLSTRQGSVQKPLFHRAKSDPPSTFTPLSRNRLDPYSVGASSYDGPSGQLSMGRSPPPTATEISAALSSLTSRSSDLPSSMASSIGSVSAQTELSYSVLTDEKDGVSRHQARSKPMSSSLLFERIDVMRSENESMVDNAESTIKASSRAVRGCWNNGKTKNEETIGANNQLCFPSCKTLARLRIKNKMKQVSGGYVNLSLNESTTSSSYISSNQQIKNIETTAAAAATTKGHIYTKTAVTPKTVCSITSNSYDNDVEAKGDDQFNSSPSGINNSSSRRHANQPKKQRHVDSFSMEQVEI
jgi:hypothetical protein